MLPIAATAHCSVACGQLADGCKSCVRGEKLVLFVTGLCPATCFYCPISEERKMRDVMYANETALTGTEPEQIAAMIEEAKACRSTGAGITGGDPLTRLDRTCAYIRALKKEFGKEFHIHLYTPLILVNERTLGALAAAGLDEIRFHPSLTGEKFWSRMTLARNYPWRVGIEIPMFPDKVAETKRLLQYVAEHKLIDFCNLNELEAADRSAQEFEKRDYTLTTTSSHAVQGSKDAGMQVLRTARILGIPAHFCTVHLKDRIQMGNRLLRRAANTAMPFDTVDDEGLFTRGAIYLSYAPDTGYARALAAVSATDRKRELAALTKIYDWLLEQGMPSDAGMIDTTRLRIILADDALRHLARELKKQFSAARCAVVTEYPTSDAFIVELEWLSTGRIS